MKNTNLFLIVTKRWYDEAASGRKMVDYREDTAYWYRRLNTSKNNYGLSGIYEHRNFETVTLQCGYSRKYPRLVFKFKETKYSECPDFVKDTVKTEYCFAIHYEWLNIFDILNLKKECKT